MGIYDARHVKEWIEDQQRIPVLEGGDAPVNKQ